MPPELNVFDSEFLKDVRKRYGIATDQVSVLDKELVEIQSRRDHARKQAEHLRGILDLADNGSSAARSPNGNRPVEEANRANRRIATADDVVALLRELGEPMHYKEIHRLIKERGFHISGKGNADTLLARYFNEPRLERVSRGTYALKASATVESVDLPFC